VNEELDVVRLVCQLVSILDLPWEGARGIIVEIIATLLSVEARRPGRPPSKQGR
jgi:hypothetical protein